ncbi:TonB-dependent receptor domain-containing protein [Allosphingosinicella deserti]|uniref:TonB-dependent receptor n=1 Tax=Allosphingosinicella deserti TaxID=2116704 RepID=A0A2P7QUZ4_9SPHN|nr:TonB-dependent receptor [Sphingomonas deserti]PSJ41773.1 TonB-dependent receptor [Sphingomonas deserti]
MKKTRILNQLLATTFICGSLGIAAPAFAQDATDVAEPTGPAEGQATPTTSAEGEPVEREQDIVITGSRIPQPNLESTAPVTVVSSQDIKLQGTTKVEDLLNSLPAVFASQASTLSNGADGTASVDLRGLGTSRTLSLVNGRRLLPGDPSPTSGSAADINIIPASILKRVEVLTGGASSTYGADAVAGVVNFIVDTDFTGIRFDGQYSFYQHENRNDFMRGLLDTRIAQGLSGYTYPGGNVADGGTFDGTVSIGTQFDDGRGHAVVYVGYRKANAVTQRRRDYSACVLQNTGGGAPRCGGSATSDNGNALVFENGTSTIYTFTPSGGFLNTSTLYNFAPTNYFQRPDERYTAGFFANYEINDQFKPYLEFMFMDDRTVAQIAPSGNFGNTLTVNCGPPASPTSATGGNPLMSQAQRDVICADENLINGFLGTFPLAVGAPYNDTPGAPAIDFTDPTTGLTYNRGYFQLLRRNVEGGPRQSDLQHTNYRTVIGTRGDIDAAWSYDAYYQYGRSNYSQVYSNEFSVQRLGRALDVVDDPRVAGINPICRSVLDGTDPNCVPYNVFVGAGGATQAAINYLSATGFQKGMTSEQVANISFTGLLGNYGFQTPWAEDGVGVNFGAEWRRESLDLQTDNAFQTGDLTGQGGATLPLSGNFRVYDLFAEAQIPLIQRNFIHDLSLNAGYRKSYYKTSADRSYDTDTYKVGVDFAPIRDIRFRGTYNRAVRAPNIQELFATNTVGLNGSDDPCAGITITATDYGCLAQGLRVGQRTAANPAGQYNGLIGGNPDLQPEKATTKTVGVVLQPTFLPRFALTVDYFDIKVDNAIRSFGQDAILAHCIDNATASVTPESCDLVNRDAAGSIWLTPGGFVRDLPNNVGQLQTKGIEVNGSYSVPLGGMGNLAFSAIGTYLDKYRVDNGLTEPYDCAGLYGPTCSIGGTTDSGAPLPKWRHKVRATLNTPQGVGLSLQWRHIGKVRAETTTDQASLTAPAASLFDPGLRIKAQNYFDLAASFTIGDNYNFRIGANNILDKQPPLVTSGNGSRTGSNLCPTGPCNGNTYPATYEALGRYIYAGITLDF